MNKSDKIYVAGHGGLAGRAICDKLREKGYQNLSVKTRGQLDLTRQREVERFFEEEKPDCVFLCAAKVGGIHANSTYPADFIAENLQIQNNVITQAFQHQVKRLVFLGSSCIYPKLCPQPIREEYLLSGPLEPTNEAYAVAKIAGIKTCEAYNRQHDTRYLSVMPTNLYGPNDNFELENSHVLPALIRKFHEARLEGKPEVIVWGTGKPKREFLHVEDMADACVFLMEKMDCQDLINIGSGKDITIKDLSILIGEVTGFKGKIVFDTTKPDGTPQKLLDVSKINLLGWKAKIGLKEGIERTYKWYQDSSAGNIRR
ncbi:MAG: GDP-L-fucose synthase [Deltaproteobacteria bacterium]|nr:GDP-L-fucose synthase [Deltaproteobacteria bacterium]